MAKESAIIAGYNTGELDRRVEIQQRTTAYEYGVPTDTWSTLTTVWAKVDEQSGGGEGFAEGKDVIVYRTKFVIRYNATVTERMRVVYESKNYDIERIEQDGRKMFSILTAKVIK